MATFESSLKSKLIYVFAINDERHCDCLKIGETTIDEDVMGISALAFALGMFIPLSLNLPLLVGGAVQWYVTSRSKDKAVNEARGERGTLIASGLIAGGALMGVFSAILRFLEFNPVNEAWLASPWSHLVSLVAYALIITYVVKACRKVKK